MFTQFLLILTQIQKARKFGNVGNLLSHYLDKRFRENNIFTKEAIQFSTLQLISLNST